MLNFFQNSPLGYIHFLFSWGWSHSPSLQSSSSSVFMGLGVPLCFHFVSFYKSILLLFSHKMGSVFPMVFYQHLLQSEFNIWNMCHQGCKQYSRRGFSGVYHNAINSCKLPLDIPKLVSISQDFVDVFHGLIILAVLYDLVIYWKIEASSPSLPILVTTEEVSSRHISRHWFTSSPGELSILDSFISLQRSLAAPWEPL